MRLDGLGPVGLFGTRLNDRLDVGGVGGRDWSPFCFLVGFER